MSPELEAAIAAVHAAGRIQVRRFRRSQAVELKGDDTPVTATDRDSEAAIKRVLEPVIPGCGFLGEETGEVQGGGDARWIVDPLDGTKKFVRGLPFFGPSVALERDGRIVLGAIHLPVLRETLWAERGTGAFLNGHPIKVSEQGQLDRAYIVCGNEIGFYQRGLGATLERVVRASYHDPGFLDLYSYASLACGRIDAVVMVGESAWDIAAVSIILEEAGGRLTDHEGIESIHHGTTLATNGPLHQPLLDILAR